MYNKIDLYKNLSIQPYLRFYEIMNYPVPKNAELFFQKKIEVSAPSEGIVKIEAKFFSNCK